ncbi:MAG: DedA family protein [Paracoccus sp. (in: a-proteobacteria)]
MNADTLLGLLPEWGPWLVGLTTFLSCLLLPVPSSLVMLAAGAFTASGDLSLATIAGGALGGAVLGDGIGYLLAGRIRPLVIARPGAARMIVRARSFLDRRGFAAVFLTRWLFSPLGPWTNLAAGLSRFGIWRFLPAVILGETLWVAIYLGLGRGFGSNYQAAADLAGSVLGLLAGLAVMALLGRYLWRRRRAGPDHAT